MCLLARVFHLWGLILQDLAVKLLELRCGVMYVCKHKFVSEEIISVIANPNDIWIRFVSL